jgi:hypothetical protein
LIVMNNPQRKDLLASLQRLEAPDGCNLSFTLTPPSEGVVDKGLVDPAEVCNFEGAKTSPEEDVISVGSGPQSLGEVAARIIERLRR